MSILNPNHGEVYFIRLLLQNVPGPRSFEDLRTVTEVDENQEVICATFEEACLRRGLLDGNDQWVLAFQEMSHSATAFQLRAAFINCISVSQIHDIPSFWEKFKDNMSDDYYRRFSDEVQHRIGRALSQHEREICRARGHNYALGDIKLQLIDLMGQQRVNTILFPDIENCDEVFVQLLEASHVGEFHPEQEREYFERNMPRANHLQRSFCHKIALALGYGAILDGQGSTSVEKKCFFLSGPGGVGKTFTYTLLLSMVRSRGHIALAVASSGVAACLLPGGRTAHSMFKISINTGPDTFCNIPKESPLADLIRRTKLIIWDEAPAQPRTVHETLDRSLRDICAFGAENQHLKDKPFGGKVVILGGDFRQTLPVIPSGTPHQIIHVSLSKSHSLWPHFEYFELKENMRVEKVRQACPAKTAELEEFATWLLQLGDGTVGNRESRYTLRVPVLRPETMIFRPDNTEDELDSLERFLENIYGGYKSICSLEESGQETSERLTSHETFLMERVIVTVVNKDVDKINNAMMQISVLGDVFSTQQEWTYHSRDTLREKTKVPVSESYLNTLEISGLPPHVLKLKIGCPVICIRNLAPSTGITNGTRMVVLDLGPKFLKVKLLTGNKAGSVHFLTKLGMSPSDKKAIPDEIAFTRYQFPIKPAFAMTIKSQGLSFEKVGIYLERPVFTHGQTYVGISRVGSMDSAIIYQPSREDPTEITNVVYHDVFPRQHVPLRLASSSTM